jgi:hypothetical protein
MFAFSILFLLSALMEILLRNHRKKAKQVGPSPANDYTSGTGTKQPFWKRKKTTKAYDTELGTVGNGVGTTDEKHHHLSPQPGYGNNGYTAAKPDKVVHDRTPYAEVHNGGLPHTARPTDVVR